MPLARAYVYTRWYIRIAIVEGDAGGHRVVEHPVLRAGREEVALRYLHHRLFVCFRIGFVYGRQKYKKYSKFVTHL